ncbi:hypothetical protein [Chromatocurvus halotolerans]|uniref:Secreted protein with PEP-CTERM sorting signal n=1 Tax=Chromatocurvus halotolerans TaxID=1132028 RepID=A0A4R2KNK8_9GAMM|nr:hypothetical protein [Chromatocurvus halotolerans]TCO74292.1 hypothetical protein EV688_1145 [Chromatocurvus halotolerans]
MRIFNSTVGRTVGAAAIAAALLLPTQASANLTFGSDMKIDTTGIDYDNGDGNTVTDIFTQFGFNQLLATSVYYIAEAGEGALPDPFTPTAGDDFRLLGEFFDTNDAAKLDALEAPTPTGSQNELTSLSPLSNSSSNLEDFNNDWFVRVFTDIEGVLTTGGPQYTGGTIRLEAFGNDIATQTVLTFTVIGSSIQAADLNLFMNVTQAASNFLFIDDGSGNFVDISTAINDPSFPSAVLDTNVNPAIPSFGDIEESALTVGTFNDRDVAWRQATLDGSVGIEVPSPGPLALIGVGLFAAGVSRFGKKRKAA